MKLAINATSAKMGGAATYLDNVLPELDRQLQEQPGSHITVWGTLRSSREGGWQAQVEFLDHPAAARGGIRRLIFDQVQLPRALKRRSLDVLFSSANFGPLRCPCRQVLLVRNPIYFSSEYYARMTSRSVRFQLLVQRWLTLRAAARAQAVLFPTQAMLEMVATYAGGPKPTWSIAPYGIRHDLFRPAENRRSDGREVRLLHVSHYCDQKDVGTLLRSLALLQARAANRFHLTLTAGFDHLKESENRHCPTLTEDRKLFKELELQGLVTDLGSVPYADLPSHYKAADLFVFPSYTESFGHPLAEAMASGLPVIAADVAVNREMCGDGAVYVPSFKPDALADRIWALAQNFGDQQKIRANGLRRAKDFTWQSHVKSLLEALNPTAAATPATVQV